MKWLVITVFCLLAGVNAQSTRIVNGENVTGVKPYYAYIEMRRLPGLEGGSYFGGGTIISVRAILTVAQNVLNFESWRVGVGAIQVAQLDWFNVEATHVHTEFDPVSLAHNIAVLRLVNNIPITSNTMPINRLPAGSPFPEEGNQGTVVGFGFGETLEQPAVLQQALLTALSQANCEFFYPHLKTNGQLDNHFCAQNTVTGANICAGDQGGPIVSEAINMLIGVQSFNRVADCASVHAQPAAFIRVSQYTAFINQHI